MLRIVSLTGSQVLIIGLFSHKDTHSYTSTSTRTHTHTHNAKPTESPQKVQTSSNWFEPGKKCYKSFILLSAVSLFF